MARDVTIKVSHPVTGLALAGSSVSVEGGIFADGGSTYVKERYYATLDITGSVTLTLATPASGTTVFTFYLPGSRPIALSIGAGPATTLHQLILDASSPVAASALQAHADQIASAGFLGHVRVGSGLAIDGSGVLSVASSGGPVAFSDVMFAGLTAGQVLIASGPTAASFGVLDLSNVNSVSGLLGVANGGTGANNSGALTWPAGGGTAALLGTANLFSVAQTMQRSGIASVSSDGLVLLNPTAAAAGVQQFSPRLRLTGQGWKTNATAASQTVDWVIENQPIQGSASPGGLLAFLSQVNGGGYIQRMSLDMGSGALSVNTITSNSAVSAGSGAGFVLSSTWGSWLSDGDKNKLSVARGLQIITGSQPMSNVLPVSNVFLDIRPTVVQTSTAAYVALGIDVTETSVGSGQNYLANLKVAGVTKFGVWSNGLLNLVNVSAPASTPSGGGYLYAEAGALKYKGSSGTVTTLGVA